MQNAEKQKVLSQFEENGKMPIKLCKQKIIVKKTKLFTNKIIRKTKLFANKIICKIKLFTNKIISKTKLFINKIIYKENCL